MSDSGSPRRERKRSHSGDAYQSDENRHSPKRRYSDRQREGEPRNELRLLIQSRDAGSVIGKGGSNIKHMRLDYKAGVTISDSGTPERALTITGDEEAMQDVCTDVFKSIADKYQSGRRDMEITGKMLVHQSQAGCVIGKAGSQLKEFRQTFEVDIKVYPACCPQSTERIVQMIGRPNSVVKCIIAIIRLLHTWPPKGFSSLYDPANYDATMVQEYGGYVDDDHTGGGGRRSDRDRYGGGGRSGSPGDRRYSGGSSRDRGGAMGRGGISFGASGAMSRRSTQQVSIPADLAGVIIGKGGNKIKQIRMDSGAEVELSDAALPGDRIITISGTPDQIQNAQYMLQTCVKQHLARN